MKSFLNTPQRKNLTVFSFIIVSLLTLLFPTKALAASNSWTMPSPIDLSATTLGDYCAAPWCKAPDYDETRTTYVRAGALRDLVVTINHKATVKNNTTNVTSDTVLVKVGDSISFLPTTPVPTDISWTGTGHNQDTPYGAWTSSRSVTCDATTEIFYGTGSGSTKYWGYVNLNINPVSPTITKGGTATLSCPSNPFNCTVTGAGSISATITWPATSGYFNYRYSKSGDTGDSGNWLPSNTCASAILFDENTIGYTHLYDWVNVIAPTAYVLPVPAQSVSFSLTATAAPSVELHFSILNSIKDAFSDFIKRNFSAFASYRQ